MSEQDTSVTESTTTDTQEQELEINLDTVDDTQVLKAELAKKDAAIKQILARAKAAEEQVKKNRETKPVQEAPAPSREAQLDEVTDLRLDGYSRDEVSFIMKNGGRKSLEENTFVKVAIEKIREQKKAEQAIPDTDSGKSDIEKRFTPEQLRNMSAAELAKILPHA